MMTIEKAANVLREYNEWSRGKHEPCNPLHTPREIGEALDTAIALLEDNIPKADFESILKAVARETGVSEKEMCSGNRHREYTQARAIASWLAYRFCGLTLTTIGIKFRRGHCNIMYYCKQVSSWLENPKCNPEGAMITRKLIDEIEQ